ncbi:hypothetical protein D1115_14100 [Vibrio alfacsensis]|uniref:Uncharacterized protein n=1 Tax=Vibrio alfacsensis TaxID=1074311 RepID=A0ABM6YWN5_9VIBR|nr:hypothetical protein [Vibrio alfacsensis]AXY02108.1 hypothetical protein D1115_14100 [Vibrio alfacsensis]
MNFIKRLFDRFGLVVEKKVYRTELEDGIKHPQDILYRSDFKRKIILDAEMEDGWGMERFSLNENSIHPFVIALKAYAKTGSQSDAVVVLKKYYKTVQPDNLAKWFSVSNSPNADKVSAIAGLFPWDSISIEEKETHVSECAVHDSLANSGDKVGLEHGWRNFGPISDELLQLEVSRLVKVYESIKSHGYVRNFNNDGDIGAFVLINKDDWKWCVDWGGQHRIAALCALGHQKLKLKSGKSYIEMTIKYGLM